MSAELLASGVSRARKVRDNVATVLIWLTVLVATVPLAFVVVYLVQKGAGIVNWNFLTDDIPISSRIAGPGMGPAVVGTLLITGAATAMAVPLGILAAVYLNEYGKKGRLAGAIRFMSDVMAGVPSIVMGLFVYTLWVLRYGQTGFVGALALGCLMLPIVIRSAETALQLVPNTCAKRRLRWEHGRRGRSSALSSLPRSPGWSAEYSSPSPGTRARRRPSSSRSGSSTRRTPTSSTAPTLGCPRRSSSTPGNRSKRPSTGPGARR